MKNQRPRRTALVTRYRATTEKAVTVRRPQPDYLQLGRVRSAYDGVPWSLFSATLPPSTRPDLFSSLGMTEEGTVCVEAPLDRPNLRFEVWPKGTPPQCLQALAALIAKPLDEESGGDGGAGCSIVYCHSQAEAERVADGLVDLGVAAA